jgi:hypothetical protein
MFGVNSISMWLLNNLLAGPIVKTGQHSVVFTLFGGGLQDAVFLFLHKGSDVPAAELSGTVGSNLLKREGHPVFYIVR